VNTTRMLIQQVACQRRFKVIKAIIRLLSKLKKNTSAPPPGPVFSENSDSGYCSGSGKNRRHRPESTPALWRLVCVRLWLWTVCLNWAN